MRLQVKARLVGWLKGRPGRAALLLGALALLGATVVVSGIVPVKASSGHWAITAWFLHFAMQRSIATHTAIADPPETGEPWRVMQGAGHYETGCRPCHGSPGRPMPQIAAAMRPHPPRLDSLVADRDPEALFYVVKHGVKFTGMPAWPTQERDDEVRSVVAFLLALPELDDAAYRALVHGDAADGAVAAPMGELDPEAAEAAEVAATAEPPEVARSCVRCHGRDGTGRGNAAFPKLAGQSEVYLLGALEAYATDRRHSGIMEPVAIALDASDRRELARYYAGLGADRGSHAGRPPPDEPMVVAAGDERSHRGAIIARDGVPARGVPPCGSCHGPGGGPHAAAYPRLGGQHEDYLAGQLRLFARRQRGGSPYVHIMELVAARLTEDQIRDVAAHYAGQGPAGERLR